MRCPAPTAGSISVAGRSAAVPHCRTDGGARAAYVDERENFTSDWNHLNVRGSARAAEIVWPAVGSSLGAVLGLHGLPAAVGPHPSDRLHDGTRDGSFGAAALVR
jgi:hypothetical protein